MQTRKLRLASFTLAGFLAIVGSADAQIYPSRPITMIVPLAAGGPTDTLARIVAEGMRASLGQPVVVENVTGAAATIGVGKAARSAARWLHPQHRQLVHARTERCYLLASVRRVEGFRADRRPCR